MDDHELRARTASALARLSHDFRTPLTSILGFSDMLAEGAYGELSPEQRDGIHDIRTSAQQLLAQVNQILDLARAENGKTTFLPEPIEVSELALEIARGFRPQALEQGVELEVEVEVREVVMDRTQLARMIQNLVANAIRHADAHVVLRLSARAGSLWVQVWDDGKGLSPQQARAVFAELFTLDRDRSSPRRGSGLGLTLVRALVERQGGEVGLDAHGPGCTAWVRLPGVVPNTLQASR